MTKFKKVAIIGAGKVGSTLAIVLQKAGFSISGVLSRTKKSADSLAKTLRCKVFADEEQLIEQSDIIIITVPDNEIQSVVKKLVSFHLIKQSKFVFHTCGSQSADSLQELRKMGAYVGSLHPLQAFSSIDLAVEKMAGTYFAVDGDIKAIEIAKELLKSFDGKVIEISSNDRAIYHAAACMASNYLVSVVYASVQMLNKVGIAENEALQALKPILQGTVDNILANGTVKALTGPIVRGDLLTIEKHLQKIDDLSNQEASVYRELGLYTIKIAEKQKQLTKQQINDLNELIKN